VLPDPDERDAEGVYTGWYPPHWPDPRTCTCTCLGVARALRLARAHGLCVGGRAVRAVEWYGAYAAERAAVARARGRETGEWGDARRVLGRRVVELLVEEERAGRGWLEGFGGALLRC